MKLLTLIALTAGLAAAQTYTGHHYTGTQCPNPNGETNCEYGGTITGDIFASYAWITDTTGAMFPAYTGRSWVPPTVNSTGTWIAYFSWDDGTGNTGSFVVANGTCTTVGGPTSQNLQSHTPVNYVTTCTGTDSNGNFVSKIHNYQIHAATYHGWWWQPVQDMGSDTTFTAVGAVQN